MVPKDVLLSSLLFLSQAVFLLENPEIWISLSRNALESEFCHVIENIVWHLRSLYYNSQTFIFQMWNRRSNKNL